MNDADNSGAHARSRRWAVLLAVAVNVLVHLALVTAGLLEESGSLMERARIYTDEVSAPINLWSTGFHLPAWLASMVTLSLIDARMSPIALVLPQLAFLAVSSLQMGLLAAGLHQLWSRGSALLRRRHTGA